MLIAVEGLDGSGKTTMLKVFVDELQILLTQNDLQTKVITTREPGGTPFAEKARELLFSDVCKPTDNVTKALLVSAARYDHIQNLIVPEIQKGNIVVTDRFFASTYAFQGIDQKVLDIVPHGLYNNTEPDHWIYMQAPVHVCIERIAKRDNNVPENYFDTTAEDEITNRFNIYEQTLNRKEPHITIIEAWQPMEEVQRQIKLCAHKLARIYYDKHKANV